MGEWMVNEWRMNGEWMENEWRMNGEWMVNEWRMNGILVWKYSVWPIYNSTMHSSTGQMPFYAMLGWKATLPVNWIYPVPKAYREMELSDWDLSYNIGRFCPCVGIAEALECTADAWVTKNYRFKYLIYLIWFPLSGEDTWFKWGGGKIC